MMRIVQLVLAASLGGLPEMVVAQSSRGDTTCVSPASATYVRCGLWLDGSKVRRGGDGIVVAKRGFFAPLPMRRLVEGDSAQRYAAVFHRSSQNADVLSLIGAAFLIGGMVVAGSYDCNPDPAFGFCTRNDDGPAMASTLLVAGSIVPTLIAAYYTLKANGAAARAIFWHNSLLPR